MGQSYITGKLVEVKQARLDYDGCAEYVFTPGLVLFFLEDRCLKPTEPSP